MIMYIYIYTYINTHTQADPNAQQMTKSFTTCFMRARGPRLFDFCSPQAISDTVLVMERF